MSTFNERRLGVILYVLCLGVLFLAGFLGIFGQRWLHRGIVYGPPHNIPLASVYPFGVNAALEQYSPSQRKRILSQLDSDGFRWIRQVLPWDRVESRPGQYAWSPWDQIVEDVARHDLSLILVIDQTPAWARTTVRQPFDTAQDKAQDTAPDADPRALPADPADLASFVGAVVDRYGSRVAALEIWREPNLQPYRHENDNWTGGPDPAQYVAYLRAAYKAAKAINPAITVLNAGLAPTTENSRRAMSDVDFLEAMYDAGAAPYFDALAARPLGFWSGPDDRRVDARVLNFSRLLLLREIMVRHGGADKAVWAVEFGWNALPADWSGPPPPWGTDDPEKQARRTVEAVRRAQAEWPWMGPMLALHLDPAAPADDPIQGFAMLDDNPSTGPSSSSGRGSGQRLVPRPTYFALRDLMAEHQVGVGHYPADAWFASTDWRSVDGAIVQRTPDGDIVVSRPSPFGRFYLAIGLLLAVAGVVAWRLDRLIPLPRWEPAVVLTLTIFLLSPWLALTLFSLFTLFTLFTFRLDLGLAIIVLFIPFFRFPKYFGPQPISVLELLTWLAAAAWFTKQVPNLVHASRFTFHVSRFTSLDYAVIALVLISLLSPLVAAHKGVAIHELRVVVIDSAVFYFLVRSSGLSRAQLWRLMDALILAGLLVALYGFYQYLFSEDVIVAEGVRRMRGVFPSPNNLSLFLGRTVPMAGVVVVWGRVRWRCVFYMVAGLIITGALYLTFSRAAWLVGLPASVLFVGLVRGRRALGSAVAAVVALVLSVLPFAGTARMNSVFALSPGSSTYRRLKLWQSAVNMIRDHPLFGVGLDNFLYQYREKYVLAGARDDPSLSHPHNLILDFWARLGLLGVVVLGWLVVAFFRKAWRLHQRLDANGQVLVLGLMASMVYALAHGFLDHSYFLVDLAYVFMLAVGMVSRLNSEQGN
ncbi:MAG: O-antigen ligase family protein [Anaerolineae bacterium]